jgi:hypothetical protein
METAERPLRESEGLGAEGAPWPGRRFLVQQHPGLSLAAAKRIRKERMGRPKGDEAMQVKILQSSVLVGTRGWPCGHKKSFATTTGG